MSGGHSRRRQKDVEQPVAAEGSVYPRRRSRVEHETPPTPSGYRSSRRSSQSGKRARKAVRVDQRREDRSAMTAGVGRRVSAVVRLAALALAALAACVALLVVVAISINALARYEARREVAAQQSPKAIAKRAKENVLIIGVDSGGSARFLAVRLDSKGKQVLGIAIPDGAFMEVPGQGFERIGDSYGAGASVSLAAISNYLSVPFTNYIVVSKDAYQKALTDQSLASLPAAITKSNMSDADRTSFSEFVADASGQDVALVPLPVKPISIGSSTYYEPQKSQVAELLLSWWNVKVGADDEALRVIIYNGSGVPGAAGVAATTLIKDGIRIVDTKNADKFTYKETLVVVQRGAVSNGDKVVQILGVGKVVDQPSDQDVADIIVIIGKDYVPPKTDSTSKG